MGFLKRLFAPNIEIKLTELDILIFQDRIQEARVIADEISGYSDILEDHEYQGFRTHLSNLTQKEQEAAKQVPSAPTAPDRSEKLKKYIAMMDIELTQGNNREAQKIADHLSAHYVKELSEDSAGCDLFKNHLKTLGLSNAKKHKQADVYQQALSEITQLKKQLQDVQQQKTLIHDAYTKLHQATQQSASSSVFQNLPQTTGTNHKRITARILAYAFKKQSVVSPQKIQDAINDYLKQSPNGANPNLIDFITEAILDDYDSCIADYLNPL